MRRQIVCRAVERVETMHVRVGAQHTSGPRRRVGATERTPIGVSLAVGATVLIVVLFMDAAVEPGPARVVLPAAVLLVFATLVRDLVATLALTAVCALLVDGFLVNRYGVLSWDGARDATGLCLLLAAGPAGHLVAAAARRSRQPHRPTDLRSVLPCSTSPSSSSRSSASPW